MLLVLQILMQYYTINEHPTFSGTKTNVTLSDDAIILRFK